MKDLMLHPHARHTIIDQCQYGTRWRKATRLQGWFVGDPLPELQLRCRCRRGLCSASHARHIVLQGRGPGNVNWTKLAEGYPSKLVPCIARWLHNGHVNKDLARLARAADGLHR